MFECRLFLYTIDQEYECMDKNQCFLENSENKRKNN